MKKIYFLLSSLATLLVPVAAQAITITNVTTNTVLFHDNFEALLPVSTIAALDGSGDFDPVAITGSYLYEEGGFVDLVQVTNFDDGTLSGPGAFEGGKYLRIVSGTQETQADLATTPSIGDHINIAFMAYFTTFGTSGNQAVFKIRGNGLGGDDQKAGARATVGGAVADLNGDPTALTYVLGQWQKWEFDYIIGENTYTMAIDGVSSGPISNLSRGGPGNIQGFGFWQGATEGSFYLDAVSIPEPNTAILLVIGFICCTCRKGKHRWSNL